MTAARGISSDVRRALERLAETADRAGATPVVFAGRTDELALLELAARGAQRGESGHTVVIQGVPGVGKTALRDEFARRLLAQDANKRQAVIPVKLDFGALDSNDYVGQRLGRRGSTVLLLVDEAQNLHDTPTVRRHLNVLHNAGDGETPMMLACFGLANTVERLADLGLSRLATGHARSIGALSDEHAREAVVGTLDRAFAYHKFAIGPDDEQKRRKWIGAAATAIVEDSGSFPHHLTNGCRALAQAVLQDGIGARPPVDMVRERSRAYRREYYEARLRPWLRYETALAHAFTENGDGQTPTSAAIAALTTVSDLGKPTDEETARDVLMGIRDAGFIEERDDSLVVLLPSLTTHFLDVRQRRQSNPRTIEAIRLAGTRSQAR